MTRAHRIHLGNAWEPVVADAQAGVRAGWRRRFGLPSGLETGTAVWLVIEQPATGGVFLNGRELPASAGGADYRHEVGGMLAIRNELLLAPGTTVADTPARPGGSRLSLPASCGRVCLEIVPVARESDSHRA